MKIVLGLLLGGFFGYTLYKVEATSPRKLLAMLRLEDLELAKVILFAIGFASSLLTIANWIGIFDVSHLEVKPINTGVIIGGIIFGLGFGYAGTCPGTCAGAVGTENIKLAISGILGGLFGAFIFSITYGKIYDMGLISSFDGGKLTLFKLSSEFPSVFNMGWSGLLLAGVLFMILAYVMPSTLIKKK